jgi:hypothetical protein
VRAASRARTHIKKTIALDAITVENSTPGDAAGGTDEGAGPADHEAVAAVHDTIGGSIGGSGRLGAARGGSIGRSRRLHAPLEAGPGPGRRRPEGGLPCAVCAA